MRRTTRVLAPLAALLLLAAACDTDDPVVELDGDHTEDATEDDTDDDAGDAADDGGDEHAEATFNGEEIAFSGVSCGTLRVDDLYEIRGRIDGGGHLQARFAYDPDASDDDDIVLASEAPTRLELFFDGEGGTIGDGEGFRADTDDLDQLDASVDHVTGTVHLAPEDNTQAIETTPEGGEISFELRCG